MTHRLPALNTDTLPRPIYRLYASGMSLTMPPPRVLLNCLPKSGTHLLSQLMRLYPSMMHAGWHIQLRDYIKESSGEYEWSGFDRDGEYDWNAFDKDLGKIRDGQFATAHIQAVGRSLDLVQARGLRTLLIYRDPRDRVVSDVSYILKRQTHFLHDRYANQMRSNEERIRASIVGFPEDERGPGRESIRENLEYYEPWLEADWVYNCRFEDLIGPEGGGNFEVQRQCVREIAEFVERPLTDQQLFDITEKVFSPDSATFRKGSIGDWRNHFTDEHKKLFKEVAGQQLIQLGYESSHQW